MPWYNVTLQTTLTVHANNEEEATYRAIDQVESIPSKDLFDHAESIEETEDPSK